ncbi:MAG: CDP-alcohol phosphatidyltransferase family protein [Acidiferrobacterales bacterium]|nr:CDP-alcohol phosphatidyltransferase family protein [Acidiferrobacterales bacterium]
MTSLASQIPNILTLSRIAAAPLLIVLLRDANFELALILFILAGFTDGLDGWIAKRFNYTSELGASLDPLADKIIIIAAYGMLTILDVIPFWLMMLVIFRDLVIVGGYLVLTTLNGSIPMQPTLTSKINTFLQITYVIAVLLNNTSWLFIPYLTEVLMIAVALSTIASGTQYVWVWAIRRDYSM